MKSRNPDVVRVLRENPLRFTCKKCGLTWCPTGKPMNQGEPYPAGWQCPNGCKA